MAQLQALLFDVDGTLADTERDGHRPAFNMAFEAAGLDWHWDEALYGQLLAVTGGKERIRYYLEAFNTGFELPTDGDGFIRGLHEAKTRFYTQLMAEGRIPLRPGVEQLIHEARAARMRLAVVTTTTPANVTALLASTLGPEAERWFEVIAAGDIVPAKKPAPDIYHWALNELRLSPDEAIAFEDSGNGVKSSVGAGVKTIVTVNGYTCNDDFSAAALVLDQMGEAGNPFTVIAGEAPGAGWLNLDLVRAVAAR